MTSLARAACAAVVLPALLAGCPSSPASAVRRDPSLGEKCGRLDPLVVEWDPAARGRIESLRSRGLVAVHYEGCDLEVLDCHASGKYAFNALTPKGERVSMRDRSALYANMPVGAASLSAKLESKGELDVDLTMVGRYEFERTSVRADELAGDCDRATHVIQAMSVGTFKFFAGSEASVAGGAQVLGAGAGGESGSKRELLSRDGDDASCTTKSGDAAPPFGCGALLRIELASIDLNDQERCNRAGTRLVSCGVRFNPQWSAACTKMTAFPSCAKSAGNDCNALALCVQKGWAAACVPSGTHSCKATADCYYACGKAGHGDDCACACTAGLDPSKALMLTKHNNCAVVFCSGLSGQAQNDCFMAHCQEDARECWSN